MSLVTCPECGKEKVSDKSEMCPECGYNIKKHFEPIRKEEERIRLLKEDDEWEQKKIENFEKEITVPKKPKIYYIAYIIEAFFSYVFVWNVLNNDEELLSPIILTIVMLIIIFITVKINIESFEEYNLAINDFESYKAERIRRYKEKAAYEKEQSRKDRLTLEILEIQNFRCPKCNSLYIDNISSADRALSVVTVGIASKKIGKQYKCRSCKHMW